MKTQSMQVCLALATAFSLTNVAAINAQPPLSEVLKKPLFAPGEQNDQHKRFVLSRIAKLKPPGSAEAWQKQANSIRQRVLDEVIFRGVPGSWRNGKPEIVDDETIDTSHGYRIRKFRFQALPGLWIPALLYEPKDVQGKVPVVLNVNGHERTGKSVDYKQLRCINLAKRGMLALNLEWIGMGQLRTDGFSHNHLAKLDLCGQAGVSVFFLAMQRGLDVLLDHPNADPKRTAVTGLSGGGWQTIILSSLDTRVRSAVPVAGHSALAQRVANRNSIGDLEQNPNDLAWIADYVHLNAIMTPRPLMLIYNTKDNCCFVASTVRGNTYEPVIPFYEQAGAGARLVYYENSDPGTHNYQLDNRQQLYKFLNAVFFPGKERDSKEIPSKDELQKHEDLIVPIPDDNADFNSLAADAAKSLPEVLDGDRDEQRALLKEILRYKPLTTGAQRFTGPQPLGNLKLRLLRLRTGTDWIVPAIVVEGAEVKRHTIVIADGGFTSQADRIRKLAEDGARVLAVDPILFGHMNPDGTLYQNAMLIATVGDRPLGLQAAQLESMARYFARVFVTEKVTIDATGPRTSLAARCAAALDGGSTIADVTTTGELKSLKSLVAPGAQYNSAPEAYCFGLLKRFDIAELKSLASQ